MRRVLVIGIRRRRSLVSAMRRLRQGAAGGSAPRGASQRLRFALIPKSLDIPVFNYAKMARSGRRRRYGNVDVI